MARLTKKQLEERLEERNAKIDDQYMEAIKAAGEKYERRLGIHVAEFEAGQAPSFKFEVKRL